LKRKTTQTPPTRFRSLSSLRRRLADERPVLCLFKAVEDGFPRGGRGGGRGLVRRGRATAPAAPPTLGPPLLAPPRRRGRARGGAALSPRGGARDVGVVVGVLRSALRGRALSTQHDGRDLLPSFLRIPRVQHAAPLADLAVEGAFGAGRVDVGSHGVDGDEAAVEGPALVPEREENGEGERRRLRARSIVARRSSALPAGRTPPLLAPLIPPMPLPTLLEGTPRRGWGWRWRPRPAAPLFLPHLLHFFWSYFGTAAV